nr:MAG TPA: hypothetical protein [Caudoviricetes sp.]
MQQINVHRFFLLSIILKLVNKGRCLHRCRPYFFIYNEVEEKYKFNQDTSLQ